MKEINGYNDVERAIKNPTPANIGWAALNFVPIGKVAKVGKIAYKGAKAIKAAKKAEKAAVKIGKAAARCNCFVAGTKVPTDHGEKNIEDIQVGDLVLSRMKRLARWLTKRLRLHSITKSNSSYAKQLERGYQLLKSIGYK